MRRSHPVFAPAVAALRVGWRPMLILQVLAIGVAIAYYQFPAVQAFSETFATWKTRGGYLFSFFAGAVLVAGIAELAKYLDSKDKTFGRKQQFDFLTTSLTYGVLLVTVDLMQVALQAWFGGGLDPVTLIKKTAFDQFIMTPFFFLPFGMLTFQWLSHIREPEMAPAPWVLVLRREFWLRRLPTVLLPAWAFWIPTLMATYAMPLKLQLVFVVFCDAAWAILFVQMAHAQNPSSRAS